MLRERVDGLAAVLAEAGDVHHESSGGPDEHRADWYARWLDGPLAVLLGFDPPMAQTAARLERDDARHRDEHAGRRRVRVDAEPIVGRADGTGGGS